MEERRWRDEDSASHDDVRRIELALLATTEKPYRRASVQRSPRREGEREGRRTGAVVLVRRGEGGETRSMALPFVGRRAMMNW